MRLVITLVAIGISVSAFLICGMIAISNPRDADGGAILAFLITNILNAAWWLPALLLTGPYYRSLSYEVQDDEVIVHAGIWTKSVKHVPYRTVTNLVVKRDIVDRLLGLGVLNIQTAGMSGQTGAEESLVGLSNVQEIYEIVVTELRRFRGGMAPTQADVEVEAVQPSNATLNAILAEIQAIRQTIEIGQ
jgi:uncharacterized membrane protein YdbT with pleckstrin-like domain